MGSIVLSRLVKSKSQRRHLLAIVFGFLTGVSLFLTIDMFNYTAHFHIPDQAQTSGQWRHLESVTEVTPGVEIIKDEVLLDVSAKRLQDAVELLASGVPKIIHQTWEASDVPLPFIPWMKSWTVTHEYWHYLFWTPEGAKRMITTHFPAQSMFYNNYPLRLQKADARRYFILYKYGGIFADLDMESTQQMDGLLQRYNCILSQHRPPDPTAKYLSFSHGYLLSNDFMACRPGHPFFKLVIDSLPEYQVAQGRNLLNTTGPYFLSAVLEEYLQSGNKSAKEYIHVVPNKWFTSAYSEFNNVTMDHLCGQESVCLDKQAICEHLQTLDRKDSDEFTSSYWQHLFGAHFTSDSFLPITKVLPSQYVI